MAGEAALSGKYTAYSDYTDSELTWLGDVPSHWVVSKFGYVKTVLTDFTANGSFADLKKNVFYRNEPSHARLVRLTDLRLNLDNQNGVWIDKDAYEYLGKSALFGGEFLLANVGAYAGLFYQMPENKGNASLAPNMFMAKFDGNKILREFMAYVGQSQSANEQLRLNATASSAQPKLNKDDFKSVRFTYPSCEEQQKIVNFLDHETAKIDTLIDKQQQLITLLKEKRQAVISHAVTKGLNPKAPMRDSGVEWLGEVPAHWGVTRLKYECSHIVDCPHSTPEYNEEGEYHAIRTADLNVGFMDTANSRCVTKETYDKRNLRLIPKPGDIIYSREGERFGIGALIPEGEKVCLAQRVMLFRIEKTPEYLMWAINSQSTYKQAQQDVIGSTSPHVNVDTIKDFTFAWPPESERQEISNYIDKITMSMDKVIYIALSKINLLKERRTALISAAVTGKIDVRNWKAA